MENRNKIGTTNFFSKRQHFLNLWTNLETWIFLNMWKKFENENMFWIFEQIWCSRIFLYLWTKFQIRNIYFGIPIYFLIYEQNLNMWTFFKFVNKFLKMITFFKQIVFGLWTKFKKVNNFWITEHFPKQSEQILIFFLLNEKKLNTWTFFVKWANF